MKRQAQRIPKCSSIHHYFVRKILNPYRVCWRQKKIANGKFLSSVIVIIVAVIFASGGTGRRDFHEFTLLNNYQSVDGVRNGVYSGNCFLRRCPRHGLIKLVSGLGGEERIARGSGRKPARGRRENWQTPRKFPRKFIEFGLHPVVEVLKRPG